MSGPEQENTQDVRHMLNEALAVARRRRWVFIIPAGLGALAALAYTFTYPRVYNARTMFERRDSLVISNLIRSYQYSPYSFSKMRRSIYVDIKGYKAVEKAVEELGLDKDLPRDANGELTETSRREKQALVNQYSSKCEVYLQDKTDTRDLVSMVLPSKDPEVASALLTRLRDNYIHSAQARMSELLAGAQQYFEKEVDEKREQVSRLETELVAFRSQFQGIDPADPEAVVNRMAALTVKAEDLQRRVDELKTQIRQNEEILGVGPTATSQPSGEGSQPTVAKVRVAEPPTRPNPAHAAKRREIQALEAQLFERKITMTDEHPQVRRLHHKIAQLQQELMRIPPTVVAKVSPGESAGGSCLRVGIDPEEQIRRQEQTRARVTLRNLKQQLRRAEGDREHTLEEIARYEKQKGLLLSQREEYLRRENELTTARTELNTKLTRCNHVSQLLNAEKNKCGITFTVLEDTQVSNKPISPKLARLLTIGLGFGVALGLACVLLLELLDRTFRTIGQVTAALQLPVLQSIGEIVTPRTRRRRLVKQVAMHAVAAGLIGLVCLATGLVYLSLERPQAFEQFRSDPGSVARQLVGSGL